MSRPKTECILTVLLLICLANVQNDGQNTRFNQTSALLSAPDTLKTFEDYQIAAVEYGDLAKRSGRLVKFHRQQGRRFRKLSRQYKNFQFYVRSRKAKA